MDDDTWFEEEYEKEFICRLPSGREIHRVKTPNEFNAEVAAKKTQTGGSCEDKQGVGSPSVLSIKSTSRRSSFTNQIEHFVYFFRFLGIL